MIYTRFTITGPKLHSKPYLHVYTFQYKAIKRDILKNYCTRSLDSNDSLMLVIISCIYIYDIHVPLLDLGQHYVKDTSRNIISLVSINNGSFHIYQKVKFGVFTQISFLNKHLSENKCTSTS